MSFPHDIPNTVFNDHMTVGKRIKNRRTELLMSVEELADKLNKDRATIYRRT